MHMQMSESRDRRPERILNRFSRGTIRIISFGHGYEIHESRVVLLEHPAKTRRAEYLPVSVPVADQPVQKW